MKKHEFQRFYETNVARIYKFVFYRVGGRKELAQDLTQDIFVKAFEAFERYDPELSTTSWIYTIARNHIINHHAKTHEQVDLEEIEDSIMVSHDAREHFAVKQDEKRLLEALTKLPSEDAKLVRMKYLEGWSFDELQDIFEKKSGALRVQAVRALDKLKTILGSL